MNTPFTRRAEAFAEALDQVGGPGVLAPGAVAAGVAPLVFLAERLVAVPQVSVSGMGAAFRAELMTQAVTALPPAAPAVPPTPTPPAAPAGAQLQTAMSSLPHAVTGTASQLVAGALALAVAVTGAGVAADRSLPGQPFYGLKRLIERIALSTAGSNLAEAGELADEASARLGELRRILAEGPLDAAAQARVERLLSELAAALDAALDRLAGVAAVPAGLIEELTRTWNTLAGLVQSLPVQLQASALTLLAEVNNRLGSIVDGASPVGDGSAVHVPAPSAPSPLPTSLAPPLPSTAPSPQPSGLPTPVMTPTTLPTPLPTPVPTVVPTTVPTTGPTVMPTVVPTAVPTSAPTSAPTGLPLPLPSAGPLVDLPVDLAVAFSPRGQLTLGEDDAGRGRSLRFAPGRVRPGRARA